MDWLRPVPFSQVVGSRKSSTEFASSRIFSALPRVCCPHPARLYNTCRPTSSTPVKPRAACQCRSTRRGERGSERCAGSMRQQHNLRSLNQPCCRLRRRTALRRLECSCSSRTRYLVTCLASVYRLAIRSGKQRGSCGDGRVNDHTSIGGEFDRRVSGSRRYRGIAS